MIPSVQHVMKKRHAARRRIRFIGFLLCTIGSMFVAYQVVESVLSGHFFSYDWDERIALMSAFVVPGAALLLTDRWWVTRLVPMPRLVCPNCAYRLERLSQPRCPECGLDLPRELLLEKPTSDARP